MRMTKWDALREITQGAENQAYWKKQRDELDAVTPTKGKTVRVKSTRSKVPHGTTGVVFFFGRSRYAPDPDRYRSGAIELPNTRHAGLDNNIGHYRVGFSTEDGSRFFCSARCVEIIK